MSLHSRHLPGFFRDSISQQIFRPDDSDLRITLSEERLSITFCHESDHHLGGTDTHLLYAALSTPPFSEFGFYCRYPRKSRNSKKPKT
jgi:hypothetical protein